MLVLAGYFVVHFFEHTLAPHFHFGEETHHQEISHAHASYAALLGLGIHTFFDGVAIASGLLVSAWLGGVIFVAIFLHKLPEGFTVASLMLASGQSRRVAFVSSVILGGTTLLGMALMFLLRGTVADRAAAVGRRYTLCGRLRPYSRSEPRARNRHGSSGISRRCDNAWVESAVSRLTDLTSEVANMAMTHFGPYAKPHWATFPPRSGSITRAGKSAHGTLPRAATLWHRRC